MSNHTPGPWVLSLGGVAGNSWNGCRINDSSGRLIATLSRNADRPMHEKAANARLITAAPAMHEALQIASAAINPPDREGISLLERNNRLKGATIQIAKALAQAGGRS